MRERTMETSLARRGARLAHRARADFGGDEECSVNSAPPEEHLTS